LNRLVWDQIGGGSMTTIGVALPEAVAIVLRDAAGRLWTAAQEETQREIDRLRAARRPRRERPPPTCKARSRR
jgi:hypothetical protein